VAEQLRGVLPVLLSLRRLLLMLQLELLQQSGRRRAGRLATAVLHHNTTRGQTGAAAARRKGEGGADGQRCETTGRGRSEVALTDNAPQCSRARQ